MWPFLPVKHIEQPVEGEVKAQRDVDRGGAVGRL